MLPSAWIRVCRSMLTRRGQTREREREEEFPCQTRGSENAESTNHTYYKTGHARSEGQPTSPLWREAEGNSCCSCREYALASFPGRLRKLPGRGLGTRLHNMHLATQSLKLKGYSACTQSCTRIKKEKTSANSDQMYNCL